MKLLFHKNKSWIIAIAINGPTHFNEKGNAIWAQIYLDFLLDNKNNILPN